MTNLVLFTILIYISILLLAWRHMDKRQGR